MKITVNGEVFDFDPVRKPMSEALAIEDALKIPYAQYEEGLQQGSARSVAAFIWLVWRRNGRAVPFASILSGETEIDLATLEMEAGPDEGETGPTTPTPTPSSTTGAATSAPSPKSSTSAHGKSGS